MSAERAAPSATDHAMWVGHAAAAGRLSGQRSARSTIRASGSRGCSNGRDGERSLGAVSTMVGGSRHPARADGSAAASASPAALKGRSLSPLYMPAGLVAKRRVPWRRPWRRLFLRSHARPTRRACARAALEPPGLRAMADVDVLMSQTAAALPPLAPSIHDIATRRLSPRKQSPHPLAPDPLRRRPETQQHSRSSAPPPSAHVSLVRSEQDECSAVWDEASGAWITACPALRPTAREQVVHLRACLNRMLQAEQAQRGAGGGSAAS